MQFDTIGKPGAGDIGARNLGMCWVRLESDQTAAWCKRAGEPNGAIAAERSNLKDGMSTDGSCEQHEQLTLTGRDIDGPQPGLLARLKCRVERRLRWH